MKTIEKDYTVAAAVMRLQVAELHDAHKELIDTLFAKHPKVMIFQNVAGASNQAKTVPNDRWTTQISPKLGNVDRQDHILLPTL